MALSRVMFQNLKKPDTFSKFPVESIQEILDVRSVSLDGIFQINEKNWSTCYEIGDVNYSISMYTEQLPFFARYSQLLSSFDTPFKVTLMNFRRNVKELERQVLYPMKGDGDDKYREAYNDVIRNGIMGANHGIKQRKYITVNFSADNYEAAKVYETHIDSAVKREFASLGSFTRHLSGNDRLKSLYDFFHFGNGDNSFIDIKDMLLSGRDWKNDVLCSYLDFSNQNYFMMDNKFCQAFYLKPSHYPRMIDDEILKELSDFGTQGMISVDYVPIRADYVNDTLEAKQDGIEREITRQQEARNRNHNYLSDISYTVDRKKKSLEDMRDDIRENDQKVLWTGVTVVVVTDTLSELENARSYLYQTAEKRTMQIQPFYGNNVEALATALPIGGRYVNEMRANFSRVTAAFLPFHVMEYQDFSNENFYYGKNRESKEPIIGNRKRLVNPSGWVFGVPGSGKSMTGAKMEIGTVHLTLPDNDIIIVDPTLEYEEICRKFHGAFININTNTTEYINPLDIPLSVFEDNNELDKAIREKFVLMRGICAQSMENGYSNKHSSVIDRAVRRLYRYIATLPPEQRFVPVMSDFLTALKQEEDESRKQYVDDVEISLDIFIDGSLGIFNHQNNIDIHSRFIVYGIRDMDDELKKVAMLIMLENIKKRVMDNFHKGKATWLYIDEFHMMLDSEYTITFVEKFYKLVRKLGCIITCLTQNASVLLASEKIATLVSNSEYFIILRNSTKDSAALVDFFENVPPSQIDVLSQAEPGTGIIRFGDYIVPLDNRMEKDNLLYEMYSTNLHEKQVMKNRQKKKERKVILPKQQIAEK